MADSLVHKESVMSQCWSRSHSPAGFNIAFLRSESLFQQVFTLDSSVLQTMCGSSMRPAHKLNRPFLRRTLNDIFHWRAKPHVRYVPCGNY